VGRRRLRPADPSGNTLEAETDEPTFGDAFEAGTWRGAARSRLLDLELVEPKEPAPVETPELFPAVVPLEDPVPVPEAVPADVA